MLILGVIHWLHTQRVRPLIRIPLLEPGVIPNKGNWILQNGLIWAALWTANIANSSWRISLLSTLISPLAVIYIGDRPREKGYRPCTKNIEWSSAGIFSDVTKWGRQDCRLFAGTSATRVTREGQSLSIEDLHGRLQNQQRQYHSKYVCGLLGGGAAVDSSGVFEIFVARSRPRMYWF